MLPRDDPFFRDRFPMPPLPPMPFGPPDPYGRMGPPLPPPMHRDRDLLYDRPNPSRPLTPPDVPERKREPLAVRESPREGVGENWGEKRPNEKGKTVDMEIIVVNRQQK